MEERVSIIGGGTAGMICAKALAGRGIDAKVYEQKMRVGRPVHASGILSLKGLATLGIRHERAVTNTLNGANIHAGGRELRIRSDNTVAAVLDRTLLNEVCMDEAVAAGADVETRKRIGASEIESMRMQGLIAGADGAVSTVARHFSMGQIARYSLTYKAEYNVSAPDPGVVDLFFDNAAYKGLFAWICPNAKDILEIGVGIDSSHGNGKLAFERFIRTKEVADQINGQTPLSEGASMIPMCRRERIFDEENGVVLIGDAAGQVKATTGGGIIFGGNAALIAADAIEGRMREGHMLSEYERIFMERYGLDMRLHAFVNRFYSSMQPQHLGAMITLMKVFGAEGFFGRYGDMDLPSLMIKRFFLRSLAD